jgi:hypothetical protein
MTDYELQKLAAKMLPEQLVFGSWNIFGGTEKEHALMRLVGEQKRKRRGPTVGDTEMLYIANLCESTLREKQHLKLANLYRSKYFSDETRDDYLVLFILKQTWQTRIILCAKAKGLI